MEDVDCRYLGGNGADYKELRNFDNIRQITMFPILLAAIRAAIGDKLLSIAVLGKQGQSVLPSFKSMSLQAICDMLGYTQKSGPQVRPSVDFINVGYCSPSRNPSIGYLNLTPTR